MKNNKLSTVASTIKTKLSQLSVIKGKMLNC